MEERGREENEKTGRRKKWKKKKTEKDGKKWKREKKKRKGKRLNEGEDEREK